MGASVVAMDQKVAISSNTSSFGGFHVHIDVQQRPKNEQNVKGSRPVVHGSCILCVCMYQLPRPTLPRERYKKSGEINSNYELNTGMLGEFTTPRNYVRKVTPSFVPQEDPSGGITPPSVFAACVRDRLAGRAGRGEGESSRACPITFSPRGQTTNHCSPFDHSY